MSEEMEMDERLEAEHRIQRALRAEAAAQGEAVLERLYVGAPVPGAPVVGATDIPPGFEPSNGLRFARWLHQRGRLRKSA